MARPRLHSYARLRSTTNANVGECERKCGDNEEQSRPHISIRHHANVRAALLRESAAYAS